MNFEGVTDIQTDIQTDRQTDRQKVMHKSPPCHWHRWAQKRGKCQEIMQFSVKKVHCGLLLAYWLNSLPCITDCTHADFPVACPVVVIHTLTKKSPRHFVFTQSRGSVVNTKKPILCLAHFGMSIKKLGKDTQN